MKNVFLITILSITSLLSFGQTDLSNVFNGKFTHISLVDFSKTEITILNDSKLMLVNKDALIIENYTYAKTEVVNTYIFERKGKSFSAKLYLDDQSESKVVYALELQNGLIFRKIIDK